MQLIDTHVHLNFDLFQGDLESVAHHWQTTEVAKLVHSCVEPDEFDSIKQLAIQFPELYCSVGLHPLSADKWQGEVTYQQIFSLAQSYAKIVAIGEIGLDFYKAENQAKQREVFSAQLEIAKQLNKPVIIHCRQAAVILRDILSQFQKAKGPIQGVMHCWTGSPEETQWFLDLGMYISFSGVVTFKNAQQVHQSAVLVPSERLLLETDCPFLAPVPHRGKRNEPAYVFYVAQKLAELRQVSLAQIAEETTHNAHQLFNLV